MAAAAGAEHFRAVLFQRDVPGGRGHFLARDVGGAEACEGFRDGYLDNAFQRSFQNEPADEGGPEPILNKTVEGAPRAQKNHRVGNQLSAGARDTSGLLKILGHSPDDGAENSSSVQRKSRQEIENGEGGIGPAEPGGQCSDRLAKREEQR